MPRRSLRATECLAQKNSSLRLATCAAVLRVQADEAMKEKLHNLLLTSVLAHVSTKSEPDALLLPLDLIDLLTGAATTKSHCMVLLQALVEYDNLMFPAHGFRF